MNLEFDKKLYINQVLATVQGEGPLTGLPSLLIRLTGCNLRCKWCDSKYTWNDIGNHPGAEIVEDYSRLEDIVSQFSGKYTLPNLMITGGEPLLYLNNPLFQSLMTCEFFSSTEIETNGILLGDIDVNKFKSSVYFNISPKLNREFYIDQTQYTGLVESLSSFIKNVDNIDDETRDPGIYYTLKFVDIKDNRDRVLRFIDECGVNPIDYPNIRIMPWTPDRKDFTSHADFMNVYNKSSKSTFEYCMKRGFTFNPRVHLYLFDDENETF